MCVYQRLEGHNHLSWNSECFTKPCNFRIYKVIWGLVFPQGFQMVLICSEEIPYRVSLLWGGDLAPHWSPRLIWRNLLLRRSCSHITYWFSGGCYFLLDGTEVFVLFLRAFTLLPGKGRLPLLSLGYSELWFLLITVRCKWRLSDLEIGKRGFQILLFLNKGSAGEHPDWPALPCPREKEAVLLGINGSGL